MGTGGGRRGDNAEHLAASLDGVATEIITVGMDGATFHRVVAGPLDDTGVKALRARMALVAGVQPWEIAEPAGKAHVDATAKATPATQTAAALLRRRAISSPPI